MFLYILKNILCDVNIYKKIVEERRREGRKEKRRNEGTMERIACDLIN